MKGDFDQGLALLMNFTEHQSYTPDQLLEKQSGEYYYILLQMNFGDKQIAWNYCERVTRDYETNLLSNYLRSFVGIKTGHNDFAIEALNKRPESMDYAPFPFLDYLMGIALLNKLQDGAAIHLKKFVTFSKGKNMIKDAYKRLSWFYLINGEVDKFNTYQNMIQKYGIANTEEDKLALRESVSRFKPNTGLLKARLLFDGGYLEKAYSEILRTIPTNTYERSEFEYRFGRICFEQKQYLKAIEHFQACISKTDPESHLYFAPASCNQMGAIYESQGNRQKAIEYYRKTLTYKGYDYKYSTTTKARQSLNRLSH
jgi:tetratricopeptide (TPR) repeat protein